jgi:hypothetical protein
MISINLKGRLGNQMFQYAICRSLAEKLGYNYYCIDLKNQIYEFFETQQGIWDGKRIGVLDDEQFNKIITNKDEYDKFVLNTIFNVKDGTFLNGLFTKLIYFDYNYDNVKMWFTPKNYNIELYNEIIKKYNYDDYYYIHFRGLDFLDINGYNLPIEYYNRCEKEFDGLKSVVITDDIPTVKKFFGEEQECISNDYKTDFVLLLNSKYSVINFSTFSWWTSYLNQNKEVLAPYGMWNGWDVESPYFYPQKNVKYINK